MDIVVERSQVDEQVATVTVTALGSGDVQITRVGGAVSMVRPEFRASLSGAEDTELLNSLADSGYTSGRSGERVYFPLSVAPSVRHAGLMDVLIVESVSGRQATVAVAPTPGMNDYQLIAAAVTIVSNFEGNQNLEGRDPTYAECFQNARDTCSPQKIKSFSYSCGAGGVVSCAFECQPPTPGG